MTKEASSCSEALSIRSFSPDMREGGTSGMMTAVIYDDLRNELYTPAHLLSARLRFDAMSSLLPQPQTQSRRFDSPSLSVCGHKRANDNLILIDSDDSRSRHNQNQSCDKVKSNIFGLSEAPIRLQLHSYASVQKRSRSTLATHLTQDEYGNCSTRLPGKTLAVIPVGT